MMKDLIAQASDRVREVVEKLDRSGKRIVYIEKENKLCGCLTDGDLRRYILAKGDLDEPVAQAMNSKPIFLQKEDKGSAKKVMEDRYIESLPIVDEKGAICDILFLHEWAKKATRRTQTQGVPAIIMAGGRGTRLAPLTDVLPKPLVPVNGKPIVERIMDDLHEAGITEFYLTVNYKAAMIKAYFDELDKPYTIHYVKEDQPLGTGGSLGLLKEVIRNGPVIVSNCDILILDDYGKMVQMHRDSEALVTIVASLKHETIPYGVIELDDDGNMQSMKEKPGFDYLASTGFYVLDASLFQRVPTDRMYHLPELVEDLLKEGQKVNVYPVTEQNWLDMGQFKEMELMAQRLRGEGQ